MTLCVCDNVFASVFTVYRYSYGISGTGINKIPYTAKLSRGKTFAVVHRTHYSLENFRGASGPCHYVLYTANDSRGNFCDWLKNHESFPPRKFCRIRYLLFNFKVVYRSALPKSVRITEIFIQAYKESHLFTIVQNSLLLSINFHFISVISTKLGHKSPQLSRHSSYGAMLSCIMLLT